MVETFYLGKYLVQRDLPEDPCDWLFPDNDEHIHETSAVQELFIRPENIDVLPETVQYGQDQWGAVTFTASGSWFSETRPPESSFYGFYIGSVIAADDFYTLFLEDC